jgi:hypothetical protein
MFKNIKKRIAQNKTIQRLASSQLFKRIFFVFVNFALLVTAIFKYFFFFFFFFWKIDNYKPHKLIFFLLLLIVPTWQIYLEEGR